MSAPKRLVIIDGYNLMFRSFYGGRMLSTSDGRPTNALFVFVNMLINLFNDERPDAMIVAMDAPGKVFRHAEFELYKGTRRETPPELVWQLEFSRQLIGDLNIPTIEKTGYEADDVAGTISRQAEARGYHTTIVSGDKDTFQLVDECVTVLMPQNQGAPPIRYTVEKVRERYGFDPIQMIDYKAMSGDTSDNIPGVPGIGDKSATLLIQQFGSVEKMLADFDAVPEKFRKKIEPYIDQMMMSKRLATIDCEAPIEYDFAPYRLSPEHLDQARQALLSLEFRSQLRRLEEPLSRYLEGGVMVPSERSSVTMEALEASRGDDLTTLNDVAAWLGNSPYGVAVESGPAQKNIFDDPDDYVLIAKGTEVRRAKFDLARAFFLFNPKNATGHDVKRFYKNAPLSLVPPGFDTMLGGYILQPGRHHYELDNLLTSYLECKEPGSDDQRAVGMMPLRKALEDRLQAEGQMRVMKEVELPLVPVLAEMEGFGIAVSRDLLHDFSKSLQVEIDRVQTLVYELAGEPFNIGSPKQIGEILFERMAIPGGKKTKTGYATGAEILSELALTYPICAEILNYRELTKLKGTYADALPKMIMDDGRIHTTYNQTVAATGRLSSLDPNLQNIPIRTELGRQIRRAFEAVPGQMLLSLDYSQIELRVLAHMCGDENLVSAFQDRVDVHTVTAGQVFQVEESQVTKEQRRLAKMLNYAVLYGVSGFGLANQLGAGFTPAASNELIKQYNERFPKVKAFTDGLVEEARFKGFTTTVIGRRRYFPDINAANWGIRQGSERQAMNAPLQGTAADMIKMAMLGIRDKIDAPTLKMLLQVHDELVFEAPNTDHIDQVRKEMEHALKLSVPIEVDAKVGPNWLDMTPVSRS